MPCGCSERRDAIGRAFQAVLSRQPTAVETVKVEAKRVASSALADLMAAVRRREQKKAERS